jgi:hypothetical protein
VFERSLSKLDLYIFVFRIFLLLAYSTSECLCLIAVFLFANLVFEFSLYVELVQNSDCITVFQMEKTLWSNILYHGEEMENTLLR